MSKPAEPWTGTAPSLGKSVTTRTVLALGAWRRKVIVPLALTSGDRAAVTTLASTPGPRPRPPPAGAVTEGVWAGTSVATEKAKIVARERRNGRWLMAVVGG